MVRTAEKVESLVEEDESFADAITAIKSVADENGGHVEWTDVENEVTSGQWGRLIEKGVLRSSDDGFEFSDPDGVEDVIDEDGGVTFPDPDTPEIEEESSWTQWDKMAGLATIAMMVGYYFDPVRDIIGGTINLFLGPIDAVLPFYAVILIAAMLTGMYSTLLQANLMDMEKMSKYQEQMKALQDRREEAKERGDDEALERIQEEQMEAMGDQIGMFKEQFRPMVWIMVLTIPIFLWIYWAVNAGQLTAAEETMVMPFAGEVTLASGIVGPMQSWIVWYFLCSLGFTQLIRKALNINTTPS
ncbi:DUF106 domain-containing protein [Natranaeroarchaeum sulfidigenes]|uniref:OxaA/SpoJ/YidC translocase/secretase, sec-independent itegration of nascent memrane proteins into membrane n=1 Tax=Natranaeroarchaeum sulfidigenes TaxID=2784880 RepID=A0A897MPJ8_9EURY|nr:DUF106 domain-containing protein [Natranaeroarchaeum sulfidigenes]QSG02342.1 OxaA/SpoJ/YidC translocase/secretase, sec-independent itegration of nascent memrane proteins into membrane [Natranaeroarchaeum sulfidigenes]